MVNDIVFDERRRIHTRCIECVAYERSDGLLDIEARLIDTKPFALVLSERGEIAPEEPIHEMALRLTVDRDLTIREVGASTFHSPFSVCGAIGESYRRLVGLQIGVGFVRRVKELFRGVAGCSHMTELLLPMASTAYQALWGDPKQDGKDGRFATGVSVPAPVDRCHALRSDGQVVKKHLPQFYRKAGDNHLDD